MHFVRYVRIDIWKAPSGQDWKLLLISSSHWVVCVLIIGIATLTAMLSNLGNRGVTVYRGRTGASATRLCLQWKIVYYWLLVLHTRSSLKMQSSQRTFSHPASPHPSRLPWDGKDRRPTSLLPMNFMCMIEITIVGELAVLLCFLVLCLFCWQQRFGRSRFWKEGWLIVLVVWTL